MTSRTSRSSCRLWRLTQAMNKNGFTLIEVIMGMAITAIIVVVISFVINTGMDSWFFMNEQGKMMADVRSAVRRMQREINRTASNESISTFSSAEYEFVDVDNNTINYQMNATNLERNNILLLENLAPSEGLEFVYLDENGIETSSKEGIRTIQFTIKVSKGTNQVLLRSSAGIRNK